MYRHFTLSSSDFPSRGYTLLTHSISHRDLFHLIGNMAALYFAGRDVGYRFGGAQVYYLYIAAAVIGGLAHVFWSQRQFSERHRFWGPVSTPPALGASGATNALVTAWILLDPFRTIYINLFIPVKFLCAIFSATIFFFIFQLLFHIQTILLTTYVYLCNNYINVRTQVPAFVMGIAFLGMDLFGLDRGGSSVSHAAHLGGMATGALWFLLWKRGMLRG